MKVGDAGEAFFVVKAEVSFIQLDISDYQIIFIYL